MSDYATTPFTSNGATTFSGASPVGAGMMYRAGYRQSVDGVSWVGSLQAMWVDAGGYMRESVRVGGDAHLRRDASYIVAEPDGDDIVSPALYRCRADMSKPPLDPASSSVCTKIDTSSPLRPAWDASALLDAVDDAAATSVQQSAARGAAQREYGMAADRSESRGQRYIITYLTKPGMGDSATSYLRGSEFVRGTQVPFVWTSTGCEAAQTNPHSTPNPAGFCGGSTDDGAKRYGNFALLNERDPRLAHRLIDWVHGVENVDDFRSRTSVTKEGGEPSTYRLGDIINSSPSLVGAPAESYDLLYGDRSYEAFRRHYQHRRQMVYVGANDGMLHAFNGGFLLGTDDAKNSIIATLRRTLPQGLSSGSPRSVSGNDWVLGQEAWALIPGGVLPHLRWLADKHYSHVAYVDATPVISDVRLWQRSQHDCVGRAAEADAQGHVCGWGTVMVVPMRTGGARISGDWVGVGSPSDKTEIAAAYTLVDITDPEQPPTVLGEIRTGTLAAFAPALLMHRETDGQLHFLLVVASGPDAQIDSAKQSVSAETGRRLGVWLFDLQSLLNGSSKPVASFQGPPDSFAGDMVAADVDLNASAESVYFGVVTNPPAGSPNGTAYGGGLWKLDLRSGTSDTSDPADWRLRPVVDAGLPVTSRPIVAMDAMGRPRLYVATGRLLTSADIDTHLAQGAQTQYIYGITDNSLLTDRAASCQRLPISDGSLLDVSREGDVGLSRPSAEHAAKLTELTHEGCYAYAGWRAALGSSTHVIGNPLLIDGQLLTTVYQASHSSAGLPEVCQSPQLCGSSALRMFDYQTGKTLPWLVGAKSEGAVAARTEAKLTPLGRGVASPPSVYAAPPSRDGQLLSICATPAAAAACPRITQLRALTHGEISWREGGDAP